MSLGTAGSSWFKTGADIVARRKKLGLTQSDFWAKVGVTQSGGCRYESGRNIPTLGVLLCAYGTERQALAVVAPSRQPALSPGQR